MRKLILLISLIVGAHAMSPPQAKERPTRVIVMSCHDYKGFSCPSYY